ncbi:TM2 domain-containing protein [Nostoc sp. MG11]|uniref:TM2 domain-containing protein n=1 Tax=Nostoc sp. MG11 TaxID=2721166 RepID=UPI0018683D6F|nr:NINE protein [Nostoc sp. MG11]
MTNLNISNHTKQLLAGYCAIIFGGFGFHKFILGYTYEGFIMLMASLVGSYFTYGLTLLIMQIVGLLEGMIYFNKSHHQFVDIYLINKRSWF